MTSQDDLLEFAGEFCTCLEGICLEEDCNACAALDPYWPCPAEMGPAVAP